LTWEKGLFDYEYRCILKRGDRIVTSGMGCCSSYESRYRWRESSRKCPQCGKEAIIRGKEEYGGGWLCFKKKGGCGYKFMDSDPSIVSQETGKVLNSDPADLKNTIMKMAKKRAKIDATLAATGSSGIFTQDMEDMDAGNVRRKTGSDSRYHRTLWRRHYSGLQPTGSREAEGQASGQRQSCQLFHLGAGQKGPPSADVQERPQPQRSQSFPA
jgi:hypothetical protein